MTTSPQRWGVIASVLEADAAATAARVAQAHPGCELVEIRADRLPACDLPGLIAGAGRPVMITVRRRRDAGAFEGDERARRGMLLTALQAGAAFVDVERGSALADLAEGPWADRVVLSDHGAACRLETLEPLYREMTGSRAARLKIVPAATHVGQLAAVRGLLRRAAGERRELACFAMGRAGMASRLLARLWGSWATYGSLARSRPTAPGQWTAAELIEEFAVDGIGESTRLFALVGDAVRRSPSPAMHNAGYRESGIDARYLALEVDSAEEAAAAVQALDLSGLAVTVPLKEAVAARSAPGDDVARGCGAVNTVRIGADGSWQGFNTDGPAMVRLIGSQLELNGAEVAVVGAGGTARAGVASLVAAGAGVTVFNRSVARAEQLGRELGAAHAGLAELPQRSWDVLIQATPLGGRGERVLPAASLSGGLVLDAVYGPRPTPLIEDARSAGLSAIDGFQLLVAQALEQFEILTGHPAPEAAMRRAGERFLRHRSSQDG